MIVSDVMMPGLDGYELCRRLRASPRTSEVPIILLTAQDWTFGRGGLPQENIEAALGVPVKAVIPYEPFCYPTQVRDT